MRAEMFLGKVSWMIFNMSRIRVRSGSGTRWLEAPRPKVSSWRMMAAPRSALASMESTMLRADLS